MQNRQHASALVAQNWHDSLKSSKPKLHCSSQPHLNHIAMVERTRQRDDVLVQLPLLCLRIALHVDVCASCLKALLTLQQENALGRVAWCPLLPISNSTQLIHPHLAALCFPRARTGLLQRLCAIDHTALVSTYIA